MSNLDRMARTKDLLEVTRGALGGWMPDDSEDTGEDLYVINAMLDTVIEDITKLRSASIHRRVGGKV